MNIFLISFAVQAIVGLVMFEWAWKRTERVRTVVEERDKLIPGFRRMDVHLWRKWQLYIGACLWLVPSFVMAVLHLAWAFIYTHLCFFGVSWDRPLTGIRRWVWMKLYNFTTSSMLRAFGYRPVFVYYSKQDVDQAYAKYLGKDWNKT
jgi:hypothetical protein